MAYSTGEKPPYSTLCSFEQYHHQMDYIKEVEAMGVQDQLWISDFEKKFGHLIALHHPCGATQPTLKRVWVPGPVIIGAGPSGLAVAACLKQLGIPQLIIERASCIASLWQLNTYDRLRLHLPKHFCQLPYYPFPTNFPTYPTKQHFITYLEAYVKYFGLKPVFNTTVVSAEYDYRLGLWRVKAVGGGGEKEKMTEYVCRWVVVAAGENSEVVVPDIEGLKEFEGRVMHSSGYKHGEEFKGKRVLVVGCGNSGMEVSLDLWNHGAFPCLVVRDSVHVLPQDMLGTSTFGLSRQLLKWLPVVLVDRILLLICRMMIGDTEQFGLYRPATGPLELKNALGKTPVLDVGTLAEIRAGNIKVFPSVIRIFQNGAKFADGRIENFDVIIFATGYKSNVPLWLKGSDKCMEKDSFPKSLAQGWKGENGLYAAGFSKGGILALSLDATRIAKDIDNVWRSSENEFTRLSRTTLSNTSKDHMSLIL